MALAYPVQSQPFIQPQRATCCANRDDDARMLAGVVALSAPPGRLLDIGCGAGAVAIPVLQARPDISIIGVDVSAARCNEAERRATRLGHGYRFAALVGSAFDVRLPQLGSIVANPPMLPTEPGFSFATGGGRDLFWMRLLSMVSAWNRPVELWLNLFDFQGVSGRTGAYPSVGEFAAAHGFSAGAVHRGWRAVGHSSSIAKALPALMRVFPYGLISVDNAILPLAELDGRPTGEMAVPHSIVHLARA